MEVEVVVVVVVVVVAAAVGEAVEEEEAEAEARLWRCPQVTQVEMKFRCYHRDLIKIYFSTRYDYSAVRSRNQILEHES